MFNTTKKKLFWYTITGEKGFLLTKGSMELMFICFLTAFPLFLFYGKCE